MEADVLDAVANLVGTPERLVRQVQQPHERRKCLSIPVPKRIRRFGFTELERDVPSFSHFGATFRAQVERDHRDDDDCGDDEHGRMLG
jgi:hypothetical protein